MDFVKKNLIMIISAGVAVLALVGLVLGISQIEGVKQVLSKAQQEMGGVSSVLDGVRVEGPGGRSMNLIPTAKAIEDKKKESALRREQGLKTLRKALQENIGYDPAKKTLKRRPIMDGIFPKPVSDDRPFKFPQQYKQAIAQLLTKMKAGGIPTDKEIAQEKELAAQNQGFVPTEEKKPAAATPKPRNRMDRNLPMSNMAERTVETAAQKLEKEAILSAADKRAKEIKVYCDLGGDDAKERPLDILSDVYVLTGGTPPPVEDMWWAQVSYWIQDDITSAIAEVNAPAKDVLESPVKRVVKIAMMHGYMVRSQSGSMDFAGRDELTAPACFADLGSDKYYDVVRFRVELIMDARKIPLFVDAMYRQSHYLMYHWEVESVLQPGLQPGVRNAEQLYRYGTVPVVKLTTHWEGYMFRDFYHWGIVGYGVNPTTGKDYVVLYNSDKPHELESEESRTGLDGLMPKAIRKLVGSEASDEAAGGEGMGGMGQSQPPSMPRRSGGGGGGNFGE